jgi:hypothetical protein
LIIRNKFDAATVYTNWIGDGLKTFLESKGHTVTDLSDVDASPDKVEYWLNFSDKRTKKAVIAFDHGGPDAFYGEINNQIAAVITKLNAEGLTKQLHVYTLACSTNADNGVGLEAVNKGCFSWLGYTEPVYAMQSDSFKACIWSYVEAMADGKTMEECEQSLRQAYQDRTTESFVYQYNLDRLLLRKNEDNMTINTHNRETEAPDPCQPYRERAMKYYTIYKEKGYSQYLCYYYRYMAAYYKCMYGLKKNRKYLCYYYRYIAAYYCCMYRLKRYKKYLCYCYLYMVYYSKCMYAATRDVGYLNLYRRYYTLYKRCM